MNPSLAEKGLEALRAAQAHGLVRIKNGWAATSDATAPEFSGLTINTLIRKGLVNPVAVDSEGRPTSVKLSGAGGRLLDKQAKGRGGVA